MNASFIIFLTKTCNVENEVHQEIRLLENEVVSLDIQKPIIHAIVQSIRTA